MRCVGAAECWLNRHRPLTLINPILNQVFFFSHHFILGSTVKRNVIDTCPLPFAVSVFFGLSLSNWQPINPVCMSALKNTNARTTLTTVCDHPILYGVVVVVVECYLLPCYYYDNTLRVVSSSRVHFKKDKSVIASRGGGRLGKKELTRIQRKVWEFPSDGRKRRESARVASKWSSRKGWCVN